MRHCALQNKVNIFSIKKVVKISNTRVITMPLRYEYTPYILPGITPTDKNFMLIQASGGINNQNVLFSLLVARGSSGGINNQNVLFSLLVARGFFITEIFT